MFPRTHGIRLYNNKKEHLFTVVNGSGGNYDLILPNGDIEYTGLDEIFVEKLLTMFDIDKLTYEINDEN